MEGDAGDKINDNSDIARRFSEKASNDESQRRRGLQAATGEVTTAAAAQATATAVAEDVLTRHQDTRLLMVEKKRPK